MALAFLFSSTNLVIELGVILWMLMGWQFAVAEWIGGVVLISIMSLIVKATYPKKTVEEAQAQKEPSKAACCSHGSHGGHEEHGGPADPEMSKKIAANYYMEWSMLGKDLLIGLLIAGLIGVFVPQHVFDILFLKSSPLWVREIVGSFIGPVIAILTFVCSIGNVPLAAIFWPRAWASQGYYPFYTRI